MAKLAIETLNKIAALATDLNYKGKRLASAKMVVCETICEQLEGLEAEQVSRFLKRETYADFWTEFDKANEKTKKPTRKAVNKPAADTMQGEQRRKMESMEVLEGTRFIVTAAQNNTVVSPVFAQLKQMAELLDATLVVLPIYYNKNAFSPAVQDDREYFAPEVKDYLVKDDVWLGEEMAIRLTPSASIIPTTQYPVNKASQLNVGELATIVPASKQQLKTLPRLANQPVKEAWATGCCTTYNYTRSGAGSEAETSHVFGGLFINIDGDSYDITNIRQGQDGSIIFYDDTIRQTIAIDGVAEQSAVVLGDLHCEMQDLACYQNTLAWLGDIKPARIAVHDILHFETRSHHNRRSSKHLYKMHVTKATVTNDLFKVVDQLNELAEYTDEVYVVESNHNSALDNWLDDSSYNPATDPENAKLYYILRWAGCEMIDQGVDKPALEVALKEVWEQADLPQLADNIVFGRMDKSEQWYGVDVSNHGHKGQNGSRGNDTLFNKWRVKLVVGHTHSPSIIGDVLTVGVMAKLDQGYNRGGASSWNQANAMIHSNGVSQMVRVNNLTK